MEYIKYLEELIPEKDSLKLVKSEAEKFYKTHSLDECVHMGHELYTLFLRILRFTGFLQSLCCVFHYG